MKLWKKFLIYMEPTFIHIFSSVCSQGNVDFVTVGITPRDDKLYVCDYGNNLDS